MESNKHSSLVILRFIMFFKLFGSFCLLGKYLYLQNGLFNLFIIFWHLGILTFFICGLIYFNTFQIVKNKIYYKNLIAYVFVYLSIFILNNIINKSLAISLSDSELIDFKNVEFNFYTKIFEFVFAVLYIFFITTFPIRNSKSTQII